MCSIFSADLSNTFLFFSLNCRSRNKIIRIADKYEWDVVEEYIDDPITDDHEDATKLRQVAYRAKLKRNTHP